MWSILRTKETAHGPPAPPGMLKSENPLPQPVMERLDQLMTELQLIKNQAMPASRGKAIPAEVSSHLPQTQTHQVMASTPTMSRCHQEDTTSNVYMARYPPQQPTHHFKSAMYPPHHSLPSMYPPLQNHAYNTTTPSPHPSSYQYQPVPQPPTTQKPAHSTHSHR